MLYVWYPEKQRDWDDVIKTLEELASVKKQLKQGKHTCLVTKLEHLRAYKTVTRLL